MESRIKYDLTPKILSYLDKHLALPMVDFLMEKKMYNEAELSALKQQILSGTKMIDCIIEDPNQKLSKEKLDSLKAEKGDILKQIELLRNQSGSLVELVDASTIVALRENADSVEAVQKGRFTSANINAFYKYGRLLFETGMYRDAYNVLTVYRFVSESEEDNYNALWGAVAAGLVDGDNWEAVTVDVQSLRDAIDQRTKVLVAEQVQQRVWFLHWLLFLAFHHAPARSMLLDCLHTYSNSHIPQGNEKMLNAMLLSAPHLLRYLCVVVVIGNKQSVNSSPYILKRNLVLRELVKVITNEHDNYTDPIVEFVYQLLVQFDFTAAASALTSSIDVVKYDFFLSNDVIIKEFFDAARVLFVDTCIRVNAQINIKDVYAQYSLNFDLLDAVQEDVIVNAPNMAKNLTAHQLIRERTRNLTNRQYNNNRV